MGACSIYYRVYRRQQARARFLRQVERVESQNQPRIICHIITPAPIATPAIQEPPPPTYQEVVAATQYEDG
ncbi:unnamed protein product [Didymodactylos carnosus]|uniref:Uncharacterized protein n=1 Tax=Didymodactylos carnosus TaxID=1234261 RepID=A0A814PVM5_9BILA|nr:unnamed protein product [Didymodactylos carnosus]CAF3874191.1 unnamed protein product [Didymodactylos carnosus]